MRKRTTKKNYKVMELGQGEAEERQTDRGRGLVKNVQVEEEEETWGRWKKVDT